MIDQYAIIKQVQKTYIMINEKKNVWVHIKLCVSVYIYRWLIIYPLNLILQY